MCEWGNFGNPAREPMSRILEDDKKKGGDSQANSQKNCGVEYTDVGQIHYFSRWDRCALLSSE